MEKRQYGLDILRIFAMLLITTIHYIAYSGILKNSEITIYNRVLLSCVSALSVSAVNLFVLITGYFSYEKKANFKRLFFLWFQVVVVGIVLLMIGAFLLKQPIGMVAIIKTLFPLSTMHYWFFTMYMSLMFLSPLINHLISHLTERMHFDFCIGGFILLSVFFVSNPFIDAKYYIADARGIVWLFYIYMVGAGFKKYNWNFLKTKSILAFLGIYGMLLILQWFQISAIKNCQLLDSNSVLPFFLSILLFSFFKNIDITQLRLKKIIGELSSCSFLVYILQEHDVIRNYYWKLFEINTYAKSPFLIFNFLISILALWPLALIFQKGCNLIRPIVNWICQKIHTFIKNKKTSGG